VLGCFQLNHPSASSAFTVPALAGASQRRLASVNGAAWADLQPSRSLAIRREKAEDGRETTRTECRVREVVTENKPSCIGIPTILGQQRAKKALPAERIPPDQQTDICSRVRSEPPKSPWRRTNKAGQLRRIRQDGHDWLSSTCSYATHHTRRFFSRPAIV
jgi:hypothetical protein